MCGRFTLVHTRREVLDHYGLSDEPSMFLQFPHYNVAPGSDIAVIRMGENGRECRDVKWGLVPHWAKEVKTGYSMINARAETVDSKPAFRAIFRKRRCLIPADGFYEWKPMNSEKQPYRFTMRGGIFSFAGLWDRWHGPDNQVIESCTIIVTDANDLVRPVHDRMPVIIDPVDYDFWLDSSITEPEALKPLLVPHSAGRMDASPVTKMVGKPSYDNPDAIESLNMETP